MFKKLFGIMMGIILSLGMVLPVKADAIIQNDFTRLNNIGMKLIKANNIQHRFTFNFTGIPNFGIYPVLIDTAYATDMNLHNNREITINIADYARATSDDEVAALIAHYLAQGENSHNGVMHGQFFWTKEVFCAKINELKYDKQAVDYLVKAGYNPAAILTAYNKTLPDWRGDIWSRKNKAATRLKNVSNYIKEKYPKYLNDNKITNSDFFPNL